MKRIISLDIIKIIAILSVIIAHTMLICKSDSNNLFTIGHTIAYSGGYPFSISGDIRSVPS